MFEHKNFVWILLLASTVPVYTQPCAFFEFPTADEFELTGEENTTLLIPFTIKQSTYTCLYAPFSIRFHKITDFSGLECLLEHENGKCQQPVRSKCLCPLNSEIYYFNHTFRRDDIWPTEWLWSTDEGVIQERKITFHVL
ncbi:hypothetical protein BaRGS_00040222, partial [Batillaria attramentaria]